jgi:hypothetical protein
MPTSHKTIAMYNDQVKTQEEAVCHLFFHCCLKDGVFKDEEIDNVSGKLVTIGLNKTMNFKKEVQKYKAYHSGITDESAYIQYLIELIKPVNDLALYSYCMELCVSDAMLGAEEELLLNKIAGLLNIDPAECAATQKLFVQRKVVEMQQLF